MVCYQGRRNGDNAKMKLIIKRKTANKQKLKDSLNEKCER